MECVETQWSRDQRLDIWDKKSHSRSAKRRRISRPRGSSLVGLALQRVSSGDQGVGHFFPSFNPLHCVCLSESDRAVDSERLCNLHRDIVATPARSSLWFCSPFCRNTYRRAYRFSTRKK